MTREQAEKDLVAILAEAERGSYSDAKEVLAHLREELLNGHFDKLSEEEKQRYEQRIRHEAEIIQALGFLDE